MKKTKEIIDGVDVSGCEYYSPIHDILLNDGQIKTIEKYCYAEDGGCNNTNCYYKQLKRKEAECEELKRYEYTYLDKFLDLKQALEEIRELIIFALKHLI